MAQPRDIKGRFVSKADLGARLDALEARQERRTDGWTNVFTGAGMMGRDKRTATSYRVGPLLDQVQLRQMYEGEGFARRIVNLPAKEMTRQWIEVEGDTDGLCLEELKRLKAKTALRDMIRWARLYGGSLGVLGLNDGQGLEAPLNLAGLKSVEFIRVYDRWRISWNTSDLYDDPNLPRYGEPEWYTVNPISGTMYRVHETRTLVMDGDPVPEETRSQNNGWGGSALQPVYQQLLDLGEAWSGTASIIQDFITATLTIDNLKDLLAAGQEDLVLKRLGLMDLSRHIINTILLDSGEEYTKQASSVSGLAELLDKFAMALSAVTGIPLTLLMGRSPAGMDSTGDADIRFWYDNVKSDQEDKLLEPLERLVSLIMAAKKGPFHGKAPEKWAIRFNPLWQLSAKEEAEFRKLVADTDAIYIDRNVLDPAEVAESRFGGEKYSMETIIDPGLREEPPEEEKEEEEPELNPDPENAPDQDDKKTHTDGEPKTPVQKWNEANPGKRHAQNVLNNALRDGKITKKPCAVCGTTKNVEAHHKDYRKPLEVIWLCHSCHQKRHKSSTSK